MLKNKLYFIHNLIINKCPTSILEIYRKNRFERHKADISLSYIPRSKKYSKFYIYEHTGTYNNIPPEIKEQSRNVFKRELRTWIQNQPDDTKD